MHDKLLKTFGSHSGPLHYFGNRRLSLPHTNGRMSVDSSWLRDSFEIITANKERRKFKRCFEPFAGSAAWSLTAMEYGLANEYHINDCNKVLINLFITIKENPDIIKETYSKLTKEFNNSKDKEKHYISTIEKHNTSNDYQKCLFISFLINHSWGGMIFHDQVGNIVYREPTINGNKYSGVLNNATLSLETYCDEIDRVSKLLNTNNVHFHSMDFREALADIQEGDFVNLNPPYPENERSLSEKYGLYVEMYSREELHKNIHDLVKIMDSRKVTYFMSYGLHNPEMKKFVITNPKNKLRHYLRLIGTKNSIFGMWLDQWYFSRDITVPNTHNLNVFSADQVLEDRELTPKEALDLFTGNFSQKSKSFA